MAEEELCEEQGGPRRGSQRRCRGDLGSAGEAERGEAAQEKLGDHRGW